MNASPNLNRLMKQENTTEVLVRSDYSVFDKKTKVLRVEAPECFCRAEHFLMGKNLLSAALGWECVFMKKDETGRPFYEINLKPIINQSKPSSAVKRGSQADSDSDSDDE